MENSTNNEKNERIFDAMLKIVADEALREEMDALPSDEELMQMYPDVSSLNKKAYAVINREFRTIRRKKSLRIFVQVAAVFCIVLVLGASVLMAHPTTRNRILNFLIDIRHDHVVFDFDLGNAPDANVADDFFYHVPEGFSLTSRQTLDTMTTYIFENESGHIIIAQHFLGRYLVKGADTDYADFTEIQLRGGVAHIFVAIYEHDFSTVMWVHGEDVISISTTLDADLLIELAEYYMAR